MSCAISASVIPQRYFPHSCIHFCHFILCERNTSAPQCVLHGPADHHDDVGLLSERLPLLRSQSTPFPTVAVRTGQTFAVVGICVLVGSTGSGYYPFFACFSLSIAGTGAAILRRRWLPLINGMLMAAIITCTVALNLSPNIIHAFEEGRGNVFIRSPAEAEIYGLKIAQLLLPLSGHRLKMFAEIKNRYNQAPLVNENDTATLGAIGGVGFLFLLGWLGFRLMRPNVNWLTRADRGVT